MVKRYFCMTCAREYDNDCIDHTCIDRASPNIDKLKVWLGSEPVLPQGWTKRRLKRLFGTIDVTAEQVLRRETLPIRDRMAFALNNVPYSTSILFIHAVVNRAVFKYALRSHYAVDWAAAWLRGSDRSYMPAQRVANDKRLDDKVRMVAHAASLVFLDIETHGVSICETLNWEGQVELLLKFINNIPVKHPYEQFAVTRQ